MRKLRAIDDQETLDRKRLIRDVRPFPNRVAAVLRVPGVQLAGIFLPAGVIAVRLRDKKKVQNVSDMW